MMAASTGAEAAAAIAGVLVRHGNTRLLMAMAQSADQEPGLRELFRALTDGILSRAAALLERLGLRPTQANGDLIHALSVGLAVIDLATGRENGEARASAVLEEAFERLAGNEPKAASLFAARD